MRGRIDEAAEHLTFDRVTEHQEAEAAKISMAKASTVKRDVEVVRHRMRMLSFGLLDPKSSLLQGWDLLVILALFWTVVVTPYEIAFLPNANWSTPANLAITALFLVDICKEFFIPYRLPHKKGGRKVTQHRQIALHYLRTWAAVDIIGTIPVDYIVQALDPASDATPLKATKMVRLARLLRLGRVLRASRVVTRLLERLESMITISFTQREVAFWTVAMLVVFHWLSCAWGLLAQLRPSQRTAELEAARALATAPVCERGPGDCLSECEQELLAELLGSSTGSGAPADLVEIQYNELWLCRAMAEGVLPRAQDEQHMWSYLYILTDMVTSFGIGIYPRHSSEYMLAFVTMLVNMVMNTFFLGVIATAMSQSDPLTREFKARMDRLNYYLSETDAPPELRVRTREYMRYTRDLYARRSFNDIYPTFSPKLRDELHAHSSLRTLRAVPLLGSCEEGFLRSLAPKLSHHGYEAGEQVLLDEACLCIVTRGTGVKGGKPITLRQYWGEDFVISSPKLRDMRPASALSYMEIVMLSRAALLESMDDWPASAKQVRLAALHLAMVRAPMLIARYFEMKSPDPQLQAAVRRGLTPIKKGFLGRGSGTQADADSERSNLSHCESVSMASIPGGASHGSGTVTQDGTYSPRSRVEEARVAQERRKVRFMREQAAHFDVALRNLGKKATTAQREFHSVMRVINGNAALRGFARDQQSSCDPEMRQQANEALKVAGDEGRLILDEEGAVVGAEGNAVFVGKREEEEPAVQAVRELGRTLRAELADLRAQVQRVQGRVGGGGGGGAAPTMQTAVVQPHAASAAATDESPAEWAVGVGSTSVPFDPYNFRPANLLHPHARRRKHRGGATMRAAPREQMSPLLEA